VTSPSPHLIGEGGRKEYLKYLKCLRYLKLKKEDLSLTLSKGEEKI